MRLPDFTRYEPLNRLKEQMGIQRDEFGSIVVIVAPGGLTADELERLVSGTGIDVAWNQITLLGNGTFVYKDSRVLIYIRDVQDFGSGVNEPRYHLTTCAAIERMHQRGRIQRYVVATEPNGIFKINIKDAQGTRSERVRLKVCRYCLGKLAIGGFSGRLPERERARIVEQFTPQAFFASYPQSPHTRLPSHDSDGAPLNDYTQDFASISKELRTHAGWQCEGCKRVLREPTLQQYLEVHHRDGNRWNNDRDNLKVVCIGCHAEEAAHHHIKSTPRYASYVRARLALSRS